MTTTKPRATPAQQLETQEQRAAEGIDAALAAASATTGAALLAAAATITAAILGPASVALGVGAAIALATAPRSAPKPTGPPPVLPPDIEADIAAVLIDAAARLDAAEDRAAEWERTRRRLHIRAVTAIHRAAAAATAHLARTMGLGLVWVTRRDAKACPVCSRLHRTTTAPGAVFAAPRGPGVPARLWSGFNGLPPAHPSCRCKVLPRRP